MRRWGILLGLFLLLFSFNSPALGAVPSVKELLLKLESDIKHKAPASEIEKDIREIEKAKEHYPIYYLPELNYLLKKEVEEVPKTGVSFIKKVLFFIEPLRRSIEVLIFFLLFYTLIFYFQHTELEPERKRFITLMVVLALASSVILNFWHGFFFFCGLGVITALIIKKRRTALFLLLAGIFLIFTHGLTQNFTKLIQSPQFLYKVKVERDGYAPEYLIDRAIKSQIHKKVELITSDLALGEIEAGGELPEIKTRDPLLKGVIYNDLGYVAFMEGNFDEALTYFKEASKYIESPIILFNLYLTYSSLLMLEEAEKIRNKLLELKIDISKASPVPLLIHVKAPEAEVEIPIPFILSMVLGFLSAFLIDRLLGFYVEQVNSGVLQIPGMMSFLNSRFRFFVIIFTVSLVVNYVLGKAICSI